MYYTSQHKVLKWFRFYIAKWNYNVKLVANTLKKKGNLE